MDEKKRLDAIQALERQINGLPIGYISKKNINGKARYYHQWTEAGKKRSRYLRDGELEPLQKQIEERRSLQAELKKLQAEMPKQSQPKLDFETSVITGRGLAAHVPRGRELAAAGLLCTAGGLPVRLWARPGLPGLRPAPGREKPPCSGRPSDG